MKNFRTLTCSGKEIAGKEEEEEEEEVEKTQKS